MSVRQYVSSKIVYPVTIKIYFSRPTLKLDEYVFLHVTPCSLIALDYPSLYRKRKLHL